MNRGSVATVDVWSSAECDTKWSISLSADDGEEIKCVGGDDDESLAWDMAMDTANQYGVPARMLALNGEVTRLYDPEDA